MAADRPLDVYSLIVSGVAEKLTPKVASLRVPRRGRGGAGESLGSGVVFTGDGFLLTNAHVVGQARSRHGGVLGRHHGPLPRDRRRPPVRPGGVRASGPTPPPAELGEADDLVVGQLVVAVGNPLGPRRLGDRGRGQCPRPVDAGPRPWTAPGSSKTSSRPTPRSTPATPAARWPTRRPGGRHQHRCGRGRAGHGRPGEQRPPGKIVAALIRDGRVRRAYLGLVSVPAPLSAPWRTGSAGPTGSGSPRWCRAARPTGPGCARATC